jgi:hypothetical protein
MWYLAAVTPIAPPQPQPKQSFFASIFSMFACLTQDVLEPAAQPTPPPAKDWNIEFDDIRHIRWLGSGAHGQVFLGHYRGDVVAVKKLKELEMTRKEMQHLHLLDHDNIIRVLGVCLRGPVYALVMEYCPETLYDIIHKQERDIPPKLVLTYASQIARGVDYLHSKHIIHRDLKVCFVM